MSEAARNKIRQTIQDAYAGKKSANKTLHKVYRIVDNDEEWEEEDDEEEDDEEEEEEESGGITGAILDILPDGDEDDDEDEDEDDE